MTLSTLNFQTSLSQFLETGNPLEKYRARAFKRLEEVGFPTPKTEAYSYLKLQGLLKTPYERASLKEPNLKLIEEKTSFYKKKPYLVIYNGHFLPRFSNIEGLDPRIIIKPLSDAIHSYNVFFKNMFDKWIEKEKDPFALLTMALHREGIFIYVPASFEQKEPIAIIEINEGGDKEIAAPFIVSSVGKSSVLNLIQVAYSDASPKFVSSTLLFMNLEDNAQARIEHSPEAKGPMRFEALRVWQKKHTRFSVTAAYINASKARFDCHVQLLGRESEAEVITLSALKEKEEVHTNILVEHHDEASYSRQLVKNLYDDESLGSFEGKIYVHSKAQQTNAYQLNQNCLLSDKATTYSKPNLEIFADDVKASHGSTTGQIDAEHLFYLQSRGLSKEEAKKLLLSSFCEEIVDAIKSEAIKALMRENLSNYFGAS